MAYKPLWDWMDEQEGKPKGNSWKNLQKERIRQGYKKLDKATSPPKYK
jgi:hypothetical protein